jgi:hypothetical protein
VLVSFPSRGRTVEKFYTEAGSVKLKGVDRRISKSRKGEYVVKLNHVAEARRQKEINKWK